MKPAWHKPLISHINLSGWTTGVELGVLRGKLSARILSNCPNVHLYLVDTWVYYPEREDDPGGETYKNIDMKEAYKEAMRKIEPYSDRATILRMKTTEAPLRVRENVDFVIVDADHRYEGVLGDIEAWWPKINPGGAMFFDDYIWPTVRGAIHDSFNEEDIVVIEEKGCFVRKDL